MKRSWKHLGAAAISAFCMLSPALPVHAEESIASYRLYNPNSGEHFYTQNAHEKETLYHAGWWYEGIGWNSPVAGTPVYRLYNPNSGEHHYTTSANERDTLVSLGWKAENTAFYSASEDKVPVYRLFNPNATDAGSHHYTTAKAESDHLSQNGWRLEGVGFYAESEGQLLADADIYRPIDQDERPLLPPDDNYLDPILPQPEPTVPADLLPCPLGEANYVCNKKTRKFHRPGCSDVRKINAENILPTKASAQEILSKGYSPCKRCNP